MSAALGGGPVYAGGAGVLFPVLAGRLEAIATV